MSSQVWYNIAKQYWQIMMWIHYKKALPAMLSINVISGLIFYWRTELPQVSLLQRYEIKFWAMLQALQQFWQFSLFSNFAAVMFAWVFLDQRTCTQVILTDLLLMYKICQNWFSKLFVILMFSKRWSLSCKRS